MVVSESVKVNVPAVAVEKVVVTRTSFIYTLPLSG